MVLPLSVCMITRDEASNIEKSLGAVKSFAKELVVLDTGSTDRTKELAQALGAKVYDFQWINDFSAAKNAAIEKATEPYILIIDADEVVTPESQQAIEAYIQSNSTPEAGRVLMHHFLEDKTVLHKVPRIFPNHPGFRFIGKIHEQLAFEGQSPPTVETGIEIHHSGFLLAERERKGKSSRNIQILTAELETHPNDPYLLYQLGKSYFIDQRNVEAVTYFQKAIDIMSFTEAPPPYLPALLLALGYALLKLEMWDTLHNVIETGLGIYPDFTDLYFLFGISLIQNKALEGEERFQEIQKAFQKCLALGNPDTAKYETVAGVGTYLAHFNLGLFFEMVENAEAAKHQYELAAREGFAKAQERLEKLKAVVV